MSWRRVATQMLAIVPALAVFAVVEYFNSGPNVQAAGGSSVKEAAPNPGEVKVSEAVEKHWENWRGTYQLMAHRQQQIHTMEDLTKHHLMVPAFTYGDFQADALEQLRRRAAAFAVTAGMKLEEEPQPSLFRARFFADRQAIALIPDGLSGPLALNAWDGLQRLTLEHRRD